MEVWKYHYGKDWAVEFHCGPVFIDAIALSSIERRIGECLDNDVLQLIAKGKEKLWTGSKQSV